MFPPEKIPTVMKHTVISVVHQKGGVGKTTISVCLAGELAQRGIELSLIDADKTGSARSWADPGRLQYPVVYQPVVEGEVRAWAEAVNKLRDRLLIIDCAPNDYSIGAATALADIAVVPCGPSGLDIEGTTQALRIIDAVRSKRIKPLPVVLVPSRIDYRTLEGRQLMEELSEFGETVSRPLRYRMDYVRAYSEGLSVNTYSPNGMAALEVRALADTVLQSLRERQQPQAAAG
jgi:chromosome partitioning protein